MTQPLKYFLCKHKDLKSDLQHPCRKPEVLVYTCNPSIGGRDSQSFPSCWLTFLAKVVHSRWETLSQSKVEHGRGEGPISGPHMHVHAHTHPHKFSWHTKHAVVFHQALASLVKPDLEEPSSSPPPPPAFSFISSCIVVMFQTLKPWPALSSGNNSVPRS